MKPLVALSLLFPLALGCAPSIDNTDSNGGDTAGGIDNVTNPGGTTTTLVDATSQESWIYMDFESGRLVEVTTPESDTSWDVGFQRFSVKLNGGVSGSGEVEARVVEGGDFEELSEAPYGGYVTDQADADDDGVPEYAMAEWYDYDYSTHVLTPADRFYVIRTVEGAYVKFQHESYYDDAGTSGHLKFTWGFVEEPGGPQDTGDPSGDTGDTAEPAADIECASGTTLVTTTPDGEGFVSVLDSSNGSVWTCMSFEGGGQVEEAPDMAWRQWLVHLPSGTWGAELPGEDYDALVQAPSSGMTSNTSDLFSDWYNYDTSTHTVTPKDKVYVLEDTRGSYWKLQITTYYENEVVHRPTFRWAAIAAP